MRLLLIRHAETASNVAGVIDTGIPGPGLTAVGEQQANDLVATLAKECVETIYVSSQVRTLLTATPLAAALSIPAVVLDGLREIPAGSLELRGDTHSTDIYLATLQSWVGGALGVRMPGGEDGHEFLHRYDSAVTEVFDSGCRVAAVFSHGGAIRTWASIRGRNVNPAFDLNHDLANTEVVVLEGSPESWFLKSKTSTG
jgi:broad specificity phosphatase PhoE